MSRLFMLLMLIIAALASLSTGGNFARADILHEQGSLRGFLGGSCPECAYDNWIGHISEGIARPGYNDYGPLDLDPQMNGFGQYTQIPATETGNALIARWYGISSALLQADTTRAESLLVTAQLDSIYDLVVLHDSTRVYYILREHLNLAYYDTQATAADSSDDVRGSFDYGWGVYVCSPSAARPNVMVQAPHPEDDFVTPYVATDVFQLFDAGVMMIAGAGREVLWTQQGQYDNTKSLSDPSRVSQTLFHAAHRAFADLYTNDFTLQLHSFDSGRHQGMKSLVVSAGADDSFPNEPILDRCAHDDMISLTPLIAVPANTSGDHPDVFVNDYYGLWYEGGYRHQGTGPVIAQTNDLMGFGQNRQIQYSHIGHNRYRNAENIIHIEMDEMPDAILDSVTVYYRTALPGVVTFENYRRALDYYRPAYQALLQALGFQPMVVRLSALPATVNFGNVPVPALSSSRVMFQNLLPNESIHVAGASTNNPVFTLTNVPENVVLAPGQACSLFVHFAPVAPTGYFGVLTLSTDSGCSHVELRGTGIAPYLLITPATVSFDTVELGVPDTLSVTCNNVGFVNLQIYAFIPFGATARFLPPSDSVIAARTNEILKIEFTPQSIGSVVCSVAVISNAFNNDTAWVTVAGTGTAIPAAVNGLTIAHAQGNMVLHWPPVTHTTRGFPLPADGYVVIAMANMAAPETLLAVTPNTIYVDSNVVDASERRFYKIIAYYGSARVTGGRLQPAISMLRWPSSAPPFRRE